MRLTGEKGVEMLEFALVIPIFVFVLYGLIAFGIMLSAKQTITHATAEGARAAIGAVPNPGENQDQAEERVAKDRVGQGGLWLPQRQVRLEHDHREGRLLLQRLRAENVCSQLTYPTRTSLSCRRHRASVS